MTEETVGIDATATEAADLRTSIREVVLEIEQLRKHMQRDQAEIEQSRARTRMMLAQLANERKVA